MPLVRALVLAILLFSARLPAATAEDVAAALAKRVRERQIVGAQLVLGDATQIRLSRSFGRRNVADGHPVTEDTLFCIGSCSKKFRWIRGFRLTLEESVRGIAGKKLASEPGGQFACSGAGYCVLGRAVGCFPAAKPDS